MKIQDLFEDIVVTIYGNREVEINGITADSREVVDGDLFVAKPGHTSNGIQFVCQAIHQGARAILCEAVDEKILSLGVPFIVHPKLGTIEGIIAARFYRDPSKKIFLVGITGTAGKTTTAYLTQKILEVSGEHCAVMGSLGCRMLEQHFKTSLNTPDIFTTSKILSKMHQENISQAVMEVTSHGLAQNRTAEIDYDVAVFTNLSHEHLDYHGTMEAYFEAKSKLFTSLKADKMAIWNADDPYAPALKHKIKGNQLTFGINQAADVQAIDIKGDAHQTRCVVCYQSKAVNIHIPLVGLFNVYNALAAICVGLARGIDLQSMARALEAKLIVPGRLQRIENRRNLQVFIDYAHKPEALKQVLCTLKPLTSGRVIVVFGCGGDRDRHKRPLMAKIAETYGDLTIVTSDNPRNEKPENIIREICAGFTKESFLVEIDRRKAIGKALDIADEKDVVLIAGKGHETTQIFADRKIYFNDAQEIHLACEKRTKSHKNSFLGIE